MFDTVLIANRAEIACRVIRTARAMGLRTVAVYSDADRDARHVQLADTALRLGPGPARDSYLNIELIIDACHRSGAGAVHPGYGFLSENADFARACRKAGIVFVGPTPEAIDALGNKAAAKQLAQRIGVPCLPGYSGAAQDIDTLMGEARRVGAPLMIKASAGGGGKGLRVAFDDKEAFEGFTACCNEARASFGDDRVFIEKFVEQPRHIEIQVLGDAHGNTVYLNERECSIQRRHQKVIEEAPSPFISDATRRAMGEQAVALAKAVRYQSAGTVEFVVGKDQSFYFLEMNTRLQVEHPVTECITGLDLVELMIRVAAGEALPFTQREVRRQGWAMECRINAEDPFRNFLPSTGRLVRFEPPAVTMEAARPVPGMDGGEWNLASIGGVRVDTGVEEGGQIPMHYDSMIAKLIVHGIDRQDAIRRMSAALNAFVIRGISSNIPFQSALLAHPRFIAGDFNTGFIAEQFAQGFRAEDVAHDDPDFLLALAAAAHRRFLDRAAAISGQLPGHGVQVGSDVVVVVKGQEGRHTHHPARVTTSSGSITVEIGGRRYDLSGRRLFRGIRVLGHCNGAPFAAQVEREAAGVWIHVAHNGRRIDAMVLYPRAAELQKLMPYKPPPDTSKLLLSPMPGLLASVTVSAGQKVHAGERLAVVEAMKMENILVALRDGVVAQVLTQPGESLAVDQPILSFE